MVPRLQQTCPFLAATSSLEHEPGSSNNAHVNNTRCSSPPSSLIPSSSSSLSSYSSSQLSAHAHIIVNDPLHLSSVNSTIPPLIITSYVLEPEYFVPPLQDHRDTNQQPPSLSGSEITAGGQDQLYMTDTDQDFMDLLDTFLESVPVEGLPCHKGESSLIDGQSSSQGDDNFLPHGTSIMPNLQGLSPATMSGTISNVSSPQIHGLTPATFMSDNISNVTSPQIPNSAQDTGHKCVKQEDTISWPRWSFPNVTHNHVGKEAADHEFFSSNLVGGMPEENDRDKPVMIYVESEKLDLHDGYVWHKYGQKKIKSKRDDHPRSYFKCARKNCPAKKMAELSSERKGHCIFTYRHRHNHQPQQSPRANSREDGGEKN